MKKKGKKMYKKEKKMVKKEKRKRTSLMIILSSSGLIHTHQNIEK